MWGKQIVVLSTSLATDYRKIAPISLSPISWFYSITRAYTAQFFRLHLNNIHIPSNSYKLTVRFHDNSLMYHIQLYKYN